jgi:hypothetical protein
MDSTGVLNAASVAGTGILAIRLYTSRLSLRYSSFFWLLIFTTLVTACELPLSVASGAYQKIYVLTEPLYWVLYAWVVLEISALVLEGYEGLATVGRWALIAAFTISLLGSTTTLLIPHQTMQSTLMSYYYVAERAVYFSLLVFLLAILYILLHYPIALSPNMVSHAVIFSLYFLFNAVMYTVLSVFGKRFLRSVEFGTQVATLLALGAWLALLRPSREERPRPKAGAGLPSREEELITQLSTLNQALLRAIKK